MVKTTSTVKNNKFKPLYSVGEEVANSITHGMGAILAVVATVFMILKANSAIEIVATSIYGGSMVLLFTMSTLYHAISHEKAKRVIRVFDHSMVFVLIAGTYTPYMLVGLRNTLGYVILAIVWATTITGIVLKIIDLERFKVQTMICCVASGWCIVVALIPMIKVLALPGIILLFIGGIMYTGGLYFYKQKGAPYRHFIWHLFVLAGALCHFISIYLYVL